MTILSIGMDTLNQVDTPVLVGWERFSGLASPVKDAPVPVSGCFYAYACSVTLGLALLPDEQYVEVMQVINATVRNGVVRLQLLQRRKAVLFLVLAHVVHAPHRLRSHRFQLIVTLFSLLNLLPTYKPNGKDTGGCLLPSCGGRYCGPPWHRCIMDAEEVGPLPHRSSLCAEHLVGSAGANRSQTPHCKLLRQYRS